jgi:hypothetical protein
VVWAATIAGREMRVAVSIFVMLKGQMYAVLKRLLGSTVLTNYYQTFAALSFHRNKSYLGEAFLACLVSVEGPQNMLYLAQLAAGVPKVVLKEQDVYLGFLFSLLKSLLL